VLAGWRPQTEAALEGQALPCGHLIPEEQPEMVISDCRVNCVHAEMRKKNPSTEQE
jgi:hypothetical protein